MRRIASRTFLFGALIGSCALLGCNNAKPNQDMQPAPAATVSEPPSDYFASDPAAGTMTGSTESSTGSAYQSPTLASAGTTPAHSATASSGGATMHTVAKGETLYSIARKYYNDGKRWKDIAKANSVTPEKLKVGQELVIP